MDPQALIAEVIAAGRATNQQRDDYREWLGKGGFPAQVTVTGFTYGDGRPAPDRVCEVRSLRRTWVDVKLAGILTTVRVAYLRAVA